jgi:hypothetical protein
MKRLHVVGCHRSGTTLIFEMLTACFRHDAHCTHEESIFNPSERSGTGLYFSKKPSDITHIQRIFFADPELYLIYMLRDPRSVITSIHPSRPDLYFSSFERWQRYQAAAGSLQRHPRFLQIRYEDLVVNPDRTQQVISDRFTFLQSQHEFSEFEKYSTASEPAVVSLSGLRPVSDRQINSWHRHLPRIRFQLDKSPHMADRLVECGYEKNHDWLNLLDGVEPAAQDYGEVTRPFWKVMETALRYRLKSNRYLRSKSLEY